MKKRFLIGSISLLAPALTQWQTPAAPLQFASGYIQSGSAIMTITGDTNLYCQFQQLNPTNDTWFTTTSFPLTSGSRVVTNSLIEGYGYFRVKGTNTLGTNFNSINAFGAMSVELPQGYSLIGNPFADLTLSNIFPMPLNNTKVYRMVSNAWTSAAIYATVLGRWTRNDTLQRGEGALVSAPTNTVAQFSGIFDTSTFTRTLTPDWSVLASPLYHLESHTDFLLDTLDSINPAGLTQLPVYNNKNPRAQVDILNDTLAATYDDYVLKTNLVWMLGTNAATVPITWGQGFLFRNVETNSVTWTNNNIVIW